MRKSLFFLSLLLIVSSCLFNRNSGPFKGYITQDGSTYYKYAGLGIKTEKILPGKMMEVFINYARMNDSVFWDSRELWGPFTILLPYDSLIKSSNYLKILLKCNEGDSICFIVKKSALFEGTQFGRGLNLPCLIADTIVRVHVKILDMLDSNQLKAKMKEYSVLAKDKEMEEQYTLTRYLTLNKIPDSDNKEGIYIIPLKEGTGPEASDKCLVSVSYRGCFMNNKTFDSIPVNDPLDFVIGNEDQVINGLETGIKRMREGEVAKIIIPSHSAFGEKGSSTGIVPPYTTLIYEVTMLQIKRP